jgi:hypothetical protein
MSQGKVQTTKARKVVTLPERLASQRIKAQRAGQEASLSQVVKTAGQKRKHASSGWYPTRSKKKARLEHAARKAAIRGHDETMEVAHEMGVEANERILTETGEYVSLRDCPSSGRGHSSTLLYQNPYCLDDDVQLPQLPAIPAHASEEVRQT